MTDAAAQLARVNAGPHNDVAVYVVIVVSFSTATGLAVVNPGDGENLTDVPYYGTPAVDQLTIMLLFNGQLALLGLPTA